MRLNPDCIRDILLSLEQLIITGGMTFTFNDFEELREYLHLEAYTADEIEYHLRQCDMNGMLVGASFSLDGGFNIRDLSPHAHEFLANIRSKSTYNIVKDILLKAGVFSLKAVVDVAASVATKHISEGL